MHVTIHATDHGCFMACYRGHAHKGAYLAGGAAPLQYSGLSVFFHKGLENKPIKD
jgi:hypothetical protein